MNPSSRVLEKAVGIVDRCGLVVGVTDTLYGLFTNPFRDECVERVYKVKKRTDKPIPLLASSIDDVARNTVVDGRVIDFLRMVWPGPVTVVLRVGEDSRISKLVHLGSGVVGFRVPASPLPRAIAYRVGGLVTGTSANISGYKPARSVSEAFKQLSGSVELYIDSGVAPIGIASTVVSLVNGYHVIREGALSTKTITRYYRMVFG